jgi:hypothetical protein
VRISDCKLRSLRTLPKTVPRHLVRDIGFQRVRRRDVGGGALGVAFGALR